MSHCSDDAQAMTAMRGRVVDFVPIPDVLLRNPLLEHTVDLPVIGIPTRFQSNSRYVCEVVERAFGAWRQIVAAPPADVPAPDSVRVAVVVHEGSEGGSRRAPIRHVCPDESRLIVHSPGSVAVTDPARRESIAYVTAALVADEEHFRDAVLETITYALLSYFDRHPVHAASIAHRGHALLLAGGSGSGKSTLAFLAQTAGLELVSDDHVWVQLTPRLAVWGYPQRLWLTTDAARLFPQLSAIDRAPSARTGKHPIDIDPCDSPRHTPRDATVCLLERRRAATPLLERVPTATVVEALTTRVEPGFDRFPSRHHAVANALAAGGGWRLTLSRDPHDALPMLRTMLDSP